MPWKDEIATHPGSRSYTAVKKSQVEKIIRHKCGLFVLLNHTKIYLIHQTAKEFLISNDQSTWIDSWKHCLRPSDSESLIAQVCVGFLPLEPFDSIKIEFCRSDGRFESKDSDSFVTSMMNRIDENDTPNIKEFLYYSAMHWASHVRDSKLTQDRLEKLIDLYRVEHHRFLLWLLIFWKEFDAGLFRTAKYRTSTDMTDIRLAAFNGHLEVLTYFVQRRNRDVDAKDKLCRTALYWAIHQSHEACVEMLLDSVADINSDIGIGIALHHACYYKREAIVKIVLWRGADVNFPQGSRGCALSAAAFRGPLSAVELLLRYGADVNVNGGFFGPPLQTAAYNRTGDVVQLLLQHKADAKAFGGFYGSPSQRPAFSEKSDSIRALLQYGADVNVSGNQGSALQLAASRGFVNVVEILLQARTDTTVLGGFHSPGLQAAASLV